MLLARHDIVAGLLALYDRPSYLEIGVNSGDTFTNVTAARKVAVDPEFRFDVASYAASDPASAFHAITSDAYFLEIGAHTAPFDVIYLDGLHTFEQTLRDLMNAFTLLNRGGAVLIDDVLPNSYDASLPDIDQVIALRGLQHTLGPVWPHDGSWMGDVFKLVFFIETFLPMFSYATVAENHGQAVVWRQERPAIVPRTMAQVARMDYRDTLLHRASFKVQPFAAILDQVRAAPAYRRARPDTW